MAKQIIDRARFELVYWALLSPGFSLCNSTRGYQAGIAWLRTVRPLANFVSPGAI